jgi:hypothetical protein
MPDLKQDVVKLALEYPEGSKERRKVQGLLNEESMNITASARKSLIRLASSLPKGSEERRAILAGLKNSGQWGSYDGVRNGVWSDTIVMSPNGDSFLVGGEETHAQDVPNQLRYRANKRLLGEDTRPRSSLMPARKFIVSEVPRPMASKLVKRLEEALDNPRDFWEVSVSYDPKRGWDI